jgi:hypothetical protein
MVDHLIDLELVAARPGLEEEVVGEVLDQIPRGGHVVAVPRLAHRRARVLTDRAGDVGVAAQCFDLVGEAVEVRDGERELGVAK